MGSSLRSESSGNMVGKRTKERFHVNRLKSRIPVITGSDRVTGSRQKDLEIVKLCGFISTGHQTNTANVIQDVLIFIGKFGLMFSRCSARSDKNNTKSANGRFPLCLYAHVCFSITSVFLSVTAACGEAVGDH